MHAYVHAYRQERTQTSYLIMPVKESDVKGHFQCFYS